jgi:hypothetical protein
MLRGRCFTAFCMALFVGAGVLIAAPVPACADEGYEAIRICKSEAKGGWNTGQSKQVSLASLEYIRCLKAAIKKQSAGIFDYQQHQSFMEDIESMAEYTRGAYLTLYNDNKYCDGPDGCGRIYRTLGYTKEMELYEGILKDVVKFKKQLEIEWGPAPDQDSGKDDEGQKKKFLYIPKGN